MLSGKFAIVSSGVVDREAAALKKERCSSVEADFLPGYQTYALSQIQSGNMADLTYVKSTAEE